MVHRTGCYIVLMSLALPACASLDEQAASAERPQPLKPVLNIAARGARLEAVELRFSSEREHPIFVSFELDENSDRIRRMVIRYRHAALEVPRSLVGCIPNPVIGSTGIVLGYVDPEIKQEASLADLVVGFDWRVPGAGGGDSNEEFISDFSVEIAGGRVVAASVLDRSGKVIGLGLKDADCSAIDRL